MSHDDEIGESKASWLFLGTSHIKGAALFPAKPTVNYGFNMGSEMLVLNSENEKKQTPNKALYYIPITQSPSLN